MAYNFTGKWQKGSQNDAPDALSHNLVSNPQSQDMLALHDIYPNQGCLLGKLELSPMMATHFRKCTANDKDFQQSLSTILSGFPDHHSQLTDVIGMFVSR